MSLHVGEVTSQVEVHGTPGAGEAPAASGASPPIWEQRERHRELADAERESCRRTAGEGFDG